MAGSVIDFIATFGLDDAPPDVVHHAKRCLLDLIGVAAAGSRMPVSGIARSVAGAQFGGAQANFLFHEGSASASGAAFVNATTIDSFDAHDGHPLTKGHAGCGSLAALLAFAGDGQTMSGSEALGHLVLGYEVAIFRTTFRPMVHALTGAESRTMMKLVVDKASDRVLGCHIVGDDAAEIIQGFAVALTAGATKAVFDATVALHPTAAEELVTMYQPVTD